MLDKNGRKIDYVRISVTDRCNLRCVYCMPEEGIRQIEHDQILTFDEILRICRCMSTLGIRKIKLTGGEPLVRKGLPELVRELKAIPGIEAVTLTTNGLLLKEQLADLVDAGLRAVNISLDTLDRERFQKVTRRDELNRVLESLEETARYPELSVKINCVPVIDQPENLVRMAGLARDRKIHVRFIEMMPIGYGSEFPFQSEEMICRILEEAYGPITPIHEVYGNGPCHYYRLEGFEGKIGFISAMTHKFCHQCNRVRLTSEGYLKACLQYQTGVDLRKILRSGESDAVLTDTIRDLIWNKPVSHSFDQKDIDEKEMRIMSQIGG